MPTLVAEDDKDSYNCYSVDEPTPEELTEALQDPWMEGAPNNDFSRLLRRFVDERRVARARRQNDMAKAQRPQRNAVGGQMFDQGQEGQGGGAGQEAAADFQ